MVAETFAAEQNRKLLWMHAAFQVSAMLVWNNAYTVEPIGQGYGVRCGDLAGVVHPSSNAPQVGELALTIAGAGTHAIPRCGMSYVAYLAKVADTVEAALGSR